MARIYRDSDGKEIGYSHTVEEQYQAWGKLILVGIIFIFHLYTPLGWIIPFLYDTQDWMPGFLNSVIIKFEREEWEALGPKILEIWLGFFYSGYYVVSSIVGTFTSLPSNSVWFLTITGSLALSLIQIYGWYLAWSKLPKLTALLYFFPLLLGLLQIFTMWLLL